jgi:hypothetical protein
MTVLGLRVVNVLAIVKEPMKDTSANTERLGFLPAFSAEDMILHAWKASLLIQNLRNLIYRLLS